MGRGLASWSRVIAGGAPLEDRAQVSAGAASGGASGSGASAACVTRPIHCWNITGSTSKRQRGGREGAGHDDHRHRPLRLAPDGRRQRRGDQPQRRQRGGHQHRAQPLARRPRGSPPRTGVAPAVAVGDGRQHEHAVERRLPDEGDEARPRRRRDSGMPARARPNTPPTSAKGTLSRVSTASGQRAERLEQEDQGDAAARPGRPAPAAPSRAPCSRTRRPTRWSSPRAAEPPASSLALRLGDERAQVATRARSCGCRCSGGRSRG